MITVLNFKTDFQMHPDVLRYWSFQDVCLLYEWIQGWLPSWKLVVGRRSFPFRKAHDVSFRDGIHEHNLHDSHRASRNVSSPPSPRPMFSKSVFVWIQTWFPNQQPPTATWRIIPVHNYHNDRRSPKSGFFPFQMALFWLTNGGDPNHLLHRMLFQVAGLRMRWIN